MNAISARQNAIGPIATSMNGRRRPRGVWNVSLQGPITSGSVSANRPSAARTAAISEGELVYLPSSGGRYAAVVVSDQARPKAPRPSLKIVENVEGGPGPGAVLVCARGRRKARGRSLKMVEMLEGCSGAAGAGETAADDIDDRPLSTGDLLVTVGKLAENPARQNLFQPAVEDPAREARVEVGAEHALRLAALDHPLDRGEPHLDVVDLLLQVRAARNLAHHHPDEVGIVPPRAQQDLGDPAQLLVGRLVRFLDPLEPPEQLAPVLAEERCQHRLLGGEVVVEEPVRDARLLGDVAHTGGVVAVPREDADGSVDDQATLLLARRLTVSGGTLLGRCAR